MAVGLAVWVSPATPHAWRLLHLLPAREQLLGPVYRGPKRFVITLALGKIGPRNPCDSEDDHQLILIGLGEVAAKEFVEAATSGVIEGTAAAVNHEDRTGCNFPAVTQLENGIGNRKVLSPRGCGLFRMMRRPLGAIS